MVRFKRSKAAKTEPRLETSIREKSGRKVCQSVETVASDHLTICWKLGKFDWDGPWGKKACENVDLKKLLDETISHIESMTWAEIYQGSGSKKKGNNSHPIDLDRLSRIAQKRLEEISLDSSIRNIVSLYVSSKRRLYGIRDGRALEILWYDRWHDNKDKAVCPSSKRGT